MPGDTPRDFMQVDVFAPEPGRGNAVAVIDGVGLSTETMATLARWTHLSETVFLLPPTPAAAERGAHYRARIFTPGNELPFAGHPTLGSAAAWTALHPHHDDTLVQECGIGLVTLRRDRERRWSFQAPPLLRSGPVDPVTRAHVADSLNVAGSEILDCAWTDNGPGWISVQLADAEAVLALAPDMRTMAGHGLNIGVCGLQPNPAPGDPLLEVRAFVANDGVAEDPVTGSLHAALAGWLQPLGILPASYTARQGRVIGFDGYVHAHTDDTGTWISGDTTILVDGKLHL